MHWAHDGCDWLRPRILLIDDDGEIDKKRLQVRCWTSPGVGCQDEHGSASGKSGDSSGTLAVVHVGSTQLMYAKTDCLLINGPLSTHPQLEFVSTSAITNSNFHGHLERDNLGRCLSWLGATRDSAAASAAPHRHGDLVASTSIGIISIEFETIPWPPLVQCLRPSGRFLGLKRVGSAGFPNQD